MMPGKQNEDELELKVSYMVKRSQGKSALGATNFKKRVFVLTASRLSYFDGTLEVSGSVLWAGAGGRFIVRASPVSRVHDTDKVYTLFLFVGGGKEMEGERKERRI